MIDDFNMEMRSWGHVLRQHVIGVAFFSLVISLLVALFFALADEGENQAPPPPPADCGWKLLRKDAAR